MNQKEGPTVSRRGRVNPVFVKLYLTDDSEEDLEDQRRAQRRKGKPQKRVMRSV